MSALGAPVALVTGASSGIGHSTALLLARDGYRVFATVRSDAGEASLRLDAAGLPIEILRLQLEDEAGATRIVQEILGRVGRIDVLVNNAGYARLGAVEDLPREALRHQFEVNVFGAMQLCREVLPTMRARGSGRIVNVSSLAGKASIPLMGAYCASKFALEAFSDALRPEAKPFGIRVVLVEPGPVATNFNEIARKESQVTLQSPSVYRQAYERLQQEGPARHAATPEQVARVILRAVRSNHPRARFRVRIRESFLSGLLALIPRGAMDWATARWMGVRSVRPE